MRILAPCGTHAAFVRHWSHSERPCDACIDAERTYQRERWRNRQSGGGRLDPAVADGLRLDLADAKTRRCWWCGEWAYDQADCAACAAPADRAALLRETS